MLLLFLLLLMLLLMMLLLLFQVIFYIQSRASSLVSVFIIVFLLLAAFSLPVFLTFEVSLLHKSTFTSVNRQALVLGVQWNLSIVDTIGTQLTVLYREVSLIQR